MGSIGWDWKTHLFIMLLLSVQVKKIYIICSKLAGNVGRSWVGLLEHFLNHVQNRNLIKQNALFYNA